MAVIEARAYGISVGKSPSHPCGIIGTGLIGAPIDRSDAGAFDIEPCAVGCDVF
jgi:hypothetical protein